MSNRKCRQSAILDLVSTNIELGLDIGPMHFHIHTELQASQSIHSQYIDGHRQIAKLAQLFKD
jgi:hypothetical protein